MKYPFYSPKKELTTTNYKHCSNTRSSYQVPNSNNWGLIFDSSAGAADQIIAFASVQARQLFTESKNRYADGTFKVCPPDFYQLYTFHTQRGGRIFSCIFVFSPNKTEVTCRRLMVVMSNLTNRSSPTNVFVNLERCAINSIQTNFANANVKGCFFHHCSNVWKHVQNIGLQVRYEEKPEFPLQIQILTALTSQDVARGFAAVCNGIRVNFGDVAKELLVYFDYIYISRFRFEAPRGNPMFSIKPLEPVPSH